ncbi:hypothetical protein ACOMHN_026433 [Nucella lapillus]
MTLKLGQIPAPHAAFSSLVNMEDTSTVSDQYTLVISGFNPIPLFHDTVYQVAAIGSHLDDLSQARVTEVTRDVTWPNEVAQVPDAVFNRTGHVIAAGGFLVPFKGHGTLTLFDLDLSPTVKHVLSGSAEDARWFYHRVMWKDMNDDGLLDIVTCRARVHILGHTEGQLVWFEHPQQSAMTQTWQSHVIAEGPDVFFTVTSLPTSEGDKECIITAGFFSKSLNIYWTTQPQNRWDDPSMIHHRVIDNTIGDVFDVTVGDLNLDGTLDLMVTNNALKNASLFSYTVPSDFRKPYILVSGDDSGQAFLLQPASNEASDWSYRHATFLDVGTSTVGGITAGDVNGDGYTEVFVPSFSQGLVYVFTFKP